MPLPQLAEALLRQRLTAISVALVAFAAAAAVTFSLPTEYDATATLMVGATGSTMQGSTPVERDETLARTYAELLRGPVAAADASHALGGAASPDAVAQRVRFEAVGGTALLRITASDRDPARAQRIANAYATTFVRRQAEAAGKAARETLERASRRLRQLALRVRRLSARRDRGAAGELEQARTELAAERDSYRARRESIALQEASVGIASPARLPDSPARPRPKLYLLVGALFAAVLGIFAGVLRDSFDTRVRREEDLAELLGAPVLGRLPRGGRTLDRSGLLDESFQLLRSSLELHDKGRRLRIIGVTSPARGEGTTLVTAGLARAFALVGARVVAVDCDLRGPSLHSRLGVDGRRGLSEILVQLEPPTKLLQDTDLVTLQVLPAGPVPPNPAVLLTRDSFSWTLKSLRESADYVICDIPPVTLGADAATASASVDGVIVVVDSRSARSTALRALGEQLENSGTTVIGVVLNWTSRYPRSARPFDVPGVGVDGGGTGRATIRQSAIAPAERSTVGPITVFSPRLITGIQAGSA